VQSHKHDPKNLKLGWDVNDWDLVWRERLLPIQGSGKRKEKCSCLKSPKSNT